MVERTLMRSVIWSRADEELLLEVCTESVCYLLHLRESQERGSSSMIPLLYRLQH